MAARREALLISRHKAGTLQDPRDEFLEMPSLLALVIALEL